MCFYAASPDDDPDGAGRWRRTGTRLADFGYRQFGHTLGALARAEGFDLSVMDGYAGYCDAHGNTLPGSLAHPPPRGRSWDTVASPLRPLFDRFVDHFDDEPATFTPQEAAAMLPRLREIAASTDWAAVTGLPHASHAMQDLLTVLAEAAEHGWHVAAYA